MGRQMNRRMGGWKCGWTDGRVNEELDRIRKGWVDRCLDGG